MDVLSLLRLLVRHWRVTAPAALLTLLGLLAAVQFSSPTYEATGSVVLLSPPEPPDLTAAPESASTPDVGQNPFARYGDLAVVSDILARVMDSDSKRAEFESQGVTGYDVVANRLQRGPVVDVTGQGPDPEAAIRSTEIVLTEVNAVLSELQQAEGADQDYFVNSAPLEPPSTATAMYGSTVRAAIAALAVGALATLGVAVLAEAVARRRTARPTAGAGPVMSDAASLSTEGGASNGSRRASWSGILPGLRLARGKPSSQGSGRRKSPQQESSKQESASQDTLARLPQRKAAQGEPSQPERSLPRATSQEPQQESSNPESASQDSQHEPAQRKAAQGESSQQEPSLRKAAFQESSQHEPGRRNAVLRESSQQEPSWQKTFEEVLSKQALSAHKPSIELPADNGHRRPTSDRSP